MGALTKEANNQSDKTLFVLYQPLFPQQQMLYGRSLGMIGVNASRIGMECGLVLINRKESTR